jgi:hypothetical protein
MPVSRAYHSVVSELRGKTVDSPLEVILI